MPWFGLRYIGSKRCYDALYFFIILLNWQTINTETTSFPLMDEHFDKPHRTIILKGQDHGNVEEIEILKPQNFELSCEITDLSNKPPMLTGYWIRGQTELEDTRKNFFTNSERVVLKMDLSINESDLGNYTCIFSYLEKKEQATFILKVPVMKEKRDRPIVTYVGDSVVLECNIKKTPNTWKWYKANGSEKALINATTDPMNYKILSGTNITKLTLLNLTKEDSGTYTCSAIFDVAPSDSHMQLKVLSFTEPLKPFLVIAAEVVVLVTLILLCERRSQSRKGQYEATENGLQSEQTDTLEQENSGVDGNTLTRQRKVEH